MAVFIETLSRCRCCFTQRFAADHAPARAQGLGPHMPQITLFWRVPDAFSRLYYRQDGESHIPPGEKSGGKCGPDTRLYKPLPGVYIAGQRALSAPAEKLRKWEDNP